MMMTIHPYIADDLATFRFEPDQWLWCLHCHRFFQGRDARPDRVGGVQACAFEDCDGAGYRVDIYDWDDWPSQNRPLRPHWPPREELRKGLVAPAGDPDAALAPAPATLDRDHARRDAILGVTGYGDDGLARFEGLDLGRLAALLQGRFIDPYGAADDGPSALEGLTFLACWPEARLRGVAAHPDREDYGVVIDGLTCDLTAVAEDRRELLREVFQQFSDAPEYREGATRLLARWG